MKKKIIIIICLLVLALVALLIPKETYQKWFGKGQSTDVSLPSNSLMVFLTTDNNKVVGKEVAVNELEDDKIRQMWNLLTINQDMLPSGYNSPLPSDAELVSYEIINQNLVINTNENIYNAKGHQALECLAWTFTNQITTEVELMVDGKKVDHFIDCNFYHINKKQGANYTLETSYLLESKATTIVYQEKDLIMPVTYFHLEEDICDYIVMKALNDENLDSNVYNYSFDDTILTIDFVDVSILNAYQIATITESIALNFDVDCLNINNNENIFYQKVFNEITNDSN